MDEEKKDRLEKAGWSIGNADDFIDFDYNIWKSKLVTDPEVMAGETVFPGHRITVKQIGQLVENGEPIKTILEDYAITEYDVHFAHRWWTEQSSTGIKCFKCKKRIGTDCPGRKKHESTLCDPCFQVKMISEKAAQAEHLLKCLDDGSLPIDKFYQFLLDLRYHDSI